MSVIQQIFSRLGYRITKNETFPKGDLIQFCQGLENRQFIPKNILDVGANKGIWSTNVKKVFSSSQFTLIEPQIEMKPYLDKFCSETPNAKWINAGAGATEGELSFTVIPDTVSSSFAISKEDAKESGFQQRLVPLITLDKVCRETIGVIPEMVKLDVEGFEYEVLKGSSTLLGKTEVILIELVFFGEHKTAKAMHEMLGIMADFGYRVYDFTSFEHRPYDGALGLCEIAFAKTNGLLRSYSGWR